MQDGQYNKLNLLCTQAIYDRKWTKLCGTRPGKICIQEQNPRAIFRGLDKTPEFKPQGYNALISNPQIYLNYNIYAGVNLPKIFSIFKV